MCVDTLNNLLTFTCEINKMVSDEYKQLRQKNPLNLQSKKITLTQSHLEAPVKVEYSTLSKLLRLKCLVQRGWTEEEYTAISYETQGAGEERVCCYCKK